MRQPRNVLKSSSSLDGALAELGQAVGSAAARAFLEGLLHATPVEVARVANTVGKAPGRRRAGGGVVRYRQGRGTFEARVIEQLPNGKVVLERITDGKRVTRPSKLVR